MLDIFRNRGLSSIVMGAVIVATVLIFVIQFNPSAGKTAAKITKTCAGTVRGTCIDPKDHKATYYILIPQDPRTGERLVGKARASGLPDIVLDGLVERQLLIDEAERLGLSVSDDEITDSIFAGYVRVSIPSDNPSLAFSMNVKDGLIFDYYRNRAPVQFFHDPKTHEFDEKLYKRNLKALFDCSEVDFREWQQRELLAQKMRDLVKAPVRVSDSEAMESYFAEKSQATVTSVEVNPEFALVFGDEPKDADIDAWAKDATRAKEIESAVATRKTDPSGPKDGHIRHILVKVPPKAQASEKAAALEKLTRAVARIRHGETFSEVAKGVSADGSAQQGGDVGDKTDSFVLPFKKAADALKPGEMTPEAIATQVGYHVIMKDDPSRLSKDIAREMYAKAHAGDWARDTSNKILADAKSGKSLDDASKMAVASIKPLPLLGIVHDPTLAPPVQADAGTQAVTDGGAVTTGDGGAASTPKTTVDPLADVAAPHPVTSTGFNEGSDPIPSLGAGDSAKLLEFAFGTAKDGDIMPDILRGGESYFVVALKQHKAATPDEYQKERDVYVETLLSRKQAEALAVYVKRLKESAKADVTRDETYMAQYHGDAGVTDNEEDQP